jgi:predicted SAM-dependent methyltransferase
MITTAPASPAPTKDFSYASGERQTAIRIQEIRPDHTSRYRLSIAILEQHLARASHPLVGLDLFCGNGYGTWLASNVLGAHLLGVDGSEEAIRVANRHYATPRTVYAHKCYPFDLPGETYDFITCFESIEHVQEPEALFGTLVHSLNPGGVLFVSTPNEAAMPLALNLKWFRHHLRHFTDADMIALAASRPEIAHVAQFGQKVYCVDQHGKVISVDESLDMLPTVNCNGAHFFIHLYLKKGPQREPGDSQSHRENPSAQESEGCDAFTPGLIDPGIRQRSELMLDVGCGEAGPQLGFVGVDIRRLPCVGIMSQAWTLERHLEPGSVSGFYSRHALEHLTFPQVRSTLSSWFRLLRPGGRVHILVPDLAFHIAQFLDPNPNGPSPANAQWTQRQHALAGFYGWQRQADHKLWDVHKSGFTFETMGGILGDAGFINYVRHDNRPWHLDIEAHKPR